MALSVAACWGLRQSCCSGRPLRQLLSLSLNDQRYSHIILAPVISACVMFLERRKVFARVVFGSKVGLIPVVGSLALYWLMTRQVAHIAETYTLSTVILTILVVWASGFAFCYGTRALASARFPFLLFLLLVPIPFDHDGQDHLRLAAGIG